MLVPLDALDGGENEEAVTLATIADAHLEIEPLEDDAGLAKLTPLVDGRDLESWSTPSGTSAPCPPGLGRSAMTETKLNKFQGIAKCNFHFAHNLVTNLER